MTDPATPSFTQRLLEPFKPFRDRLKPHEAWLRGLAALAVAYLGFLAAMARAATPGEASWTAGNSALTGALVAIGLILIYALFEVVDDHFTDQDAAVVAGLTEELARERRESDRRRQIRELDRDVNGFCRAIVNEIATQLPKIRVHDVAAHVWLCNDANGIFVRRWAFHLRENRGRSGVAWSKGKGVAGWAWESEQHQTVSLALLHEVHEQGKDRFAELGEEERFGMSYQEVARTKDAGYTGIVVRLVYARDERSGPIAILGLDYSGAPTQFAAVAGIMNREFVGGIRGILESRLTTADKQKILWSALDD